MAVSHLFDDLKYSTMELIFDHTLGKQEHTDVVLCRPMAIVDSDEEHEALDRGWLALDHPVMGREVFYQSRSTRINLDLYRPRYRQHQWDGRDIGIKIIDASEMVRLLGLPTIYDDYMKRKGFSQDYTPFANYNARDQFMLFYVGTADNIIGFTKQKRYKYEMDHYSTIDTYDSRDLAGLESVIHANTVAVSDITLDMEIGWASDNYVSYFYMGSGYEKSSLYKANFRGFEWWTGTEWSTNKRQYRRLCERDSRIESFRDLGNLSLLPDKS
jgi:hypothetical protein